MAASPSRTHLLAFSLVLAGAALAARLWAQTPPVPTVTAAPATPGGLVGAPGGVQGGRGVVPTPDPPGADFLKRPPLQRLDPAVQQQLFLLPPGFTIEPVLADPVVQSPVGITFDGNGRMYVLEMRSYMRDADGTGAHEPISRITRFEDTNGDGTYERRTVFVDNMVMPRIAFPIGDGVILALETNNRDLYTYTDTDGDGVSDRKALFYPGFGRVTNMEWQPGGLTQALDNWIYSTYNPFRLRIMPGGKILREETDPNGGQWWSAQDNYGKMWWVDGGGELGPVNFQTPIIYGAYTLPDQLEPDFRTPWPAPGGIADMQGGMNRVRLPDGTLNNFTAAAGVEIYRGDRLPADMVGDLFFNEPVGRIVRRAKIVVNEGLTQLRNAYPKSEFIRSTDPLFRPVSISNAPDGTLYLVDMYVGIIQDAQFVGAYLRRKVEQYGLDKHSQQGRIWRITHAGNTPDRRQPRMYTDPAATLVEHLGHPNGWWRDHAQQALVARQDPSVVPALRTMMQTSANPLARIHALWTLEGLTSLTAADVRLLLKDADPMMRVQAIRASETLYKNGDKTWAADYRNLLNDANHDVVIQAMLTMNLHKVPDYAALIRAKAEASTVRGVRELGVRMLQPSTSQGQRPSLADTNAFGLNLTTDQRRQLQRGEATYRELCFTCHGEDGKGAPMAGAAPGALQAPALQGSPRVTDHADHVIKVMLHGLTGPIDGVTYGAGVMVPLGSNTDEWISDAANYVRNAFGNQSMFVTPAQVAAVRRATASRRQPWTMATLAPTVTTALTNTGAWKLSASHNPTAAGNALNGAGAVRWDTGAPQAPEMWFQIELPEPTMVTEVQFDAVAPGGRGGGRGVLPAGPPVSYRVQVSLDGTTWGQPLAQGVGENPTSLAAFAPVQARFVRITQTGSAATGWAIQRLRVYKVGR